MTEQEIIQVVTDFMEGRGIEYSGDSGKTWNETNNPIWDFSKYLYRSYETGEFKYKRLLKKIDSFEVFLGIPEKTPEIMRIHDSFNEIFKDEIKEARK